MPGGGGSPPSDLAAVIKHEAASILSGVDPAGAFVTYNSTVIAHDALDAAHSSSGGNPYTLIESWDSDSELAAVDTEYDEYDAFADGLDPATDITAAIAQAIVETETNMGIDSGATSGEVQNLVDAMQDNSKVEMLKDVSRVFTGMYEVRAVMTTSMGMAVAQVEHQRTIALADQEARFRLFIHRERTESILQLTNTYLMERRSQVETARLSTAMRGDIARNRIVVEMDRINFDTHIEGKEALWDLELFGYYGNLIASMTGAAQIPRAMTERERVLNAVMTSASSGIQAGQALGSPQGGLAFGVASLAANLWGQGIV